jgi:hypothetical protein
MTAETPRALAQRWGREDAHPESSSYALGAIPWHDGYRMARAIEEIDKELQRADVGSVDDGTFLHRLHAILAGRSTEDIDAQPT